MRFLLLIATASASTNNVSGPADHPHLRKVASRKPWDGILDCGQDQRIGCGGGLGGNKILGNPRHTRLPTVHEEHLEEMRREIST